MRAVSIFLITACLSILSVRVCALQPKSVPANTKIELTSPNEILSLNFILNNGVPAYKLQQQEVDVILPSKLGLVLKEKDLTNGFELIDFSEQSFSETWTQPWGEEKEIENTYKSLTVNLNHSSGIKMNIIFKLYNDGLGFRYEWPEQEELQEFVIIDEKTEFRLANDHEAWWIQAYIPNRYEHLTIASRTSDVDTAATPITMKTKEGLYLSFHEANLTDYSSMSLINRGDNLFEATLFPWTDGTNDKVRASTPFVSPWRSIKVNESPGDLVTNYLELNLNEPNKIEDTSWIKPGKYVGIWWDMHLDTKTWSSGERHGATTEYTKEFIDFAAEHGFDGVLVEGWNIGWDGNWIENSDQFNFTEPYPDYDLEYLTEYAQSKGTNIVMHNETSTGIENYERQMEEAFALYEKLGIRAIKSGYVGDMIANGQWHHGQYMVRHYRKVVELAAKHKIVLDVHEPVKDTGIRRTWPNMMTREGARGQEYNAWSGDGGNPPNHIPSIVFTRMLSGPFDYTPGVLDLLLEDNAEGRPNNRVHSTMAGELAIYVVIYSPLHMAADLIKNYEKYPEPFQFIKDVPVDWETTKVLNAEIGEYVTIVRKDRNSEDWYLGSVTNEQAREFTFNLDFLDEGKYEAQMYVDGEDADFETSPYSMDKTILEVNQDFSLTVKLARGGGAAIRFKKLGN